jgi:membrane glycosyltransferase
MTFAPRALTGHERRAFGMVNGVVRILMLMAGSITSWFVARDASNFSVIQGVVAMLLIAFFVSVASFWPSIVGFLAGKRSIGRRVDV